MRPDGDFMKYNRKTYFVKAGGARTRPQFRREQRRERRESDTS
jgi:hypothetical protein